MIESLYKSIPIDTVGKSEYGPWHRIIPGTTKTLCGKIVEANFGGMWTKGGRDCLVCKRRFDIINDMLDLKIHELIRNEIEKLRRAIK